MKGNWILGASCLLLVHAGSEGLLGQETSGPYLGLEPPGMTAEPFTIPGLSGHRSLGCSGFLRGGTVFVFNAMRPGSDWRFMPTYWTELRNGTWTPPQVVPWSDYLPYNFTIGPAGQTVWFTSLKSPDLTNRMLLEQANIWAVSLHESGWTVPVMLGPSINTESFYENYPSVSSDGTIYFMSRREQGQGRTDLFRARNLDGRYAEAENLGATVNSPESDQDPFIAPDESYLIYCLTGRSDSFGSYDLYVSFPDGKDGWLDPKNLGQGVNSAGAEFRPYVTPDGKYLFFTSSGRSDDGLGRIFWIDASVIEDLR